MQNKNLKEGEDVARRSLFMLLLLGILKMTAGIITGMQVIIADAISTFADTLGVFASYLGLRLSRKTEDSKFEYGYYKVETFAALLVSVGIIYAGYSILKNVVLNLGVQEMGQFRSFALTSTTIAIILSYRLARKLEKAGKKVNSLSLLANARDKKGDVFAGVIILISIIANYKQIPYVENIVTTLIALVILKEGAFSTKESLFFLLDYWDDPILSKKIRRVFGKEKDIITKVKRLRLRRAGTFIFGEAFIEINPYAGIDDLRDELDLLKGKIMELNPYIKDFSIYTHISKSKNVKIAVPIKEGSGLNAKLANNLRHTIGYVFVQVRKGKITGHKTKKLNINKNDTVELANFLKKEKVKILINSKLNSMIYFNLRRTHHILIYPRLSNVKRVKETVELLLIDT